MKKNKFQAFVLISLPAIFLSGCFGGGGQQVIDQFEETLSTIETGRMAMEVRIESAGDGALPLTIFAELDLAFDRIDETLLKSEGVLNFSLDAFTDGGQAVAGGLDADWVVLGSQLMVRLNGIDINLPQFALFKPALQSYLGRWFQFGESAFPSDFQSLLSADQDNTNRISRLLGLFEEVDMLIVMEDYGVLDLNGRQVHHYQVKIDRDGLKEYIQQMAELDGIVLTEEEIKTRSELAELIELELWIDAETFHLAQMALFMSGSTASQEQNVPSGASIDLFITTDPFNQPVGIQHPVGVEIFDPTELILNVAAVSAEAVDSSGVGLLEEGQGDLGVVQQILKNHSATELLP